MKKITSFIFLTIFAATCAQAKSPFEGSWIIDRYSTATGGTLTIKNCKNDVCNFYLDTENGSHICSFEGEIKIKGNEGEYKTIVKNIFDEDSEFLINFKLNHEKNIITVAGEGYHLAYCGFRGYFEGEYENENNPLRYETGFDCWAKNLTDTEKTVCANEFIAGADKEISLKYKDVMPLEWKKERDKCKTDVKCLWKFYSQNVRYGYERVEGKALNFYEYMGSLDDDKFYTPTDFALIGKYLQENMEEEDYKSWIRAFGVMSLDDCHDCHFLTYGLPGLFTSVESAFYIDKDDLWVAFLHEDLENDKNNYIVMYALKGKTINDIPEKYNDWLVRLKQFFSKEIKLKHFINPINSENDNNGKIL